MSKNKQKNARLMTSIKADMRFQHKHGFYIVYIFMALLYLIVLSQFEINVTKTMLPIIVYLDPSVLGLFFIGSMIMLEKEQGILSLLYITPLRIREYMISKLITLTSLAMMVGFVISFITYRAPVNYLLLAVGILLTAVFYALIGFMVSTNANTVNEYMVNMIPWMLLLVVPCFALIPNSFIPQFVYPILNIIPSVAGLKLLIGSYTEMPTWEIILCIASLTAINCLIFIKTKKLFAKKVMLQD